MIVAGVAMGHIVAIIAPNPIVAVAAAESVVSRAAADAVVAPVAGDGIVAAAAVDAVVAVAAMKHSIGGYGVINPNLVVTASAIDVDFGDVYRAIGEGLLVDGDGQIRAARAHENAVVFVGPHHGQDAAVERRTDVCR